MIKTRLSGGLGNQMFEYAAARALALRNNTEVQLDLTYLLDRTPRPKRWHFTFRNYDLDVFAIHATIAKKNETPLFFLGKIGLFADKALRRVFKPKGTEKYYQFDPSFLTLPDGTYLDGGWQSPKYFAGYEDVIQKDFTLKNPIPEKTEALVAEIRNSESVCVHLRRGDFLKVALHTVCDEDYYKRGIAEVAKHTSFEKIYVFSDDIAWCRENLSLGYPTEFVSDDYSGFKSTGHMYLMSQCKYFVIANSSFSWWSAWLSKRAGKLVIAPKHWFSDHSIDTSDVTPKEWIRV